MKNFEEEKKMRKLWLMFIWLILVMIPLQNSLEEGRGHEENERQVPFLRK